MNCWEQKYIQEYHRSGKLIMEQQTYKYNPPLCNSTRKKRKNRISHTRKGITITGQDRTQHTHCSRHAAASIV